MKSKMTMQQAMLQLDACGVNYRRLTDWQLKVGYYNFFPSKGTIYRDGDSAALPEKGLPAFLELLRKRGLAPKVPQRASKADHSRKNGICPAIDPEPSALNFEHIQLTNSTDRTH